MSAIKTRSGVDRSRIAFGWRRVQAMTCLGLAVAASARGDFPRTFDVSQGRIVEGTLYQNMTLADKAETALRADLAFRTAARPSTSKPAREAVIAQYESLLQEAESRSQRAFFCHRIATLIFKFRDFPGKIEPAATIAEGWWERAQSHASPTDGLLFWDVHLDLANVFSSRRQYLMTTVVLRDLLAAVAQNPCLAMPTVHEELVSTDWERHQLSRTRHLKKVTVEFCFHTSKRIASSIAVWTLVELAGHVDPEISAMARGEHDQLRISPSVIDPCVLPLFEDEVN